MMTKSFVLINQELHFIEIILEGLKEEEIFFVVKELISQKGVDFFETINRTLMPTSKNISLVKEKINTDEHTNFKESNSKVLQNTKINRELWLDSKNPNITKIQHLSEQLVPLDFSHEIIDLRSELYLTVQKYCNRWHILNNNLVEDIVSNGIKIFIKAECQNVVKNMFSNNPKEYFLNSESKSIVNVCLKEFLDLNIISIISSHTTVIYSKIFVVTEKHRTTKHRLIFNMKKLNTYLTCKSISRITHKILWEINYFNYAGLIDISKAYLHIPINNDYKKYFCFAFNGVSYCFNAMPFGLKSAPWIFHSVTMSIWSYLRDKYQINIIAYLDDVLIVGDTFEDTLRDIKITCNFLMFLGFKLNLEKSTLKPVTEFDYLGMHISLKEKTVANSQRNVNKIIDKCNMIREKKFLSKREVESFIGSINFAINFLPNERYFLHEMINFFNQNFPHRLDRDMQIIPAALPTDIAKWSNIQHYKAINFPAADYQAVIHVDASKQGWGALFLMGNQRSIKQGTWTSRESAFSSNNKEMQAVYQALIQFQKLIIKKNVIIYSDNMTTVSTLKKGGSHSSTIRQELARKIFQLTNRQRCQIMIRHIRGHQNLLPDLTSRHKILLPVELNVSKNLFMKMCHSVSLTPQVDLFATKFSAKCKIYFSALEEKEAAGLDAFAANWDRFQILYAFPPPVLIPRIVYRWKKRQTKGTLILIAPYWPTKTWFSQLLKITKRKWKLPIMKKGLHLISEKGLKFYSMKKLHLHAFIL